MWRYGLGRAFLWLTGWRLEAVIPAEKKFVVIAAPHTSNWDLIFMLAASYVMRLHFAWIAKHTLFVPPLGWLLSWLGGIPIDRGAPGGVVAQMIERFARSESLVLAVPAEGTRKRTEYWKSGFYRIALGAGVPLSLGFLDYRRKICGLGPTLTPSGDAHADMDLIRAFYRDMTGKHPDQAGIPRLREEAAVTDEARR